MNVLWIGTDLFKAYHDPRTGRVDVIASRFGAEGEAICPDPALEIVVDEGGAVCALSLETGGAGGVVLAEMPARPAECLAAVDAEVEVPDAPVRWAFDPSLGTLAVSFGEVEPERWGRLGDNLVWLALDDDARLAAVLVEGVSRDPGGRGQLAWLDELGVEE